MSRSCTYAGRDIAKNVNISSFMGHLKEKSSMMEQLSELKYKYRNKEFWSKEYYIDTTEKKADRIDSKSIKRRSTGRIADAEMEKSF